MPYGRTAATPSVDRDQALSAAGVALIFVGVVEGVFGFWLFTRCTVYILNSAGCADYVDTGGGFPLLVAGIGVLLVGVIVYLIGRRPKLG